MNISSDAAEQLVRISLQGIEVAAKITGSGAKNVAVMLYAIAKDQQKIKGKTKLSNMLKSGKELKVFSIRQEDIKKFTEESKRYGVLFSAIVDKKNINTDGMIDIIVRAEDAGKINRIVNRFKLATINMATVKSEVTRINNNRNEKNTTLNQNNEKLSNPQIAKMEKSPLSEHSSTNKKYLEQGSNFNKSSVRKEIKKIKAEQEIKLDNNKKVIKNKTTNKSRRKVR